MFIIPKPYAFRKDMIALQNGETKKPLKERIPVPVIVLAVVTLVAGLALSGVFTMTKDSIEAQQLAKKAESFKEVCPEAESFETADTVDQAIADLGGAVYGSGFGRSYINTAVVGKDASGNTVGYVISITNADGYDGTITISLGLDTEGTITGVSFTELHETPGMGMLCDEPAFKDQFNGRKVEAFELLKKGGSSADTEIDSVSGASTTSGAVVNAVNAGLDFFHTVIVGGGE